VVVVVVGWVMKRHACGCGTLEVKAPACSHVTPEVVRNAKLASHYLHMVVVRRTGGQRARSPAGSTDAALRTLGCSVCTKMGDCAEAVCFGKRLRLSACLQCFFIGCHHHGHLEQHFDWSEHKLALDLELQKVYCHSCKGYVYNCELDQQIELGRREVMQLHRRTRQKVEPTTATAKMPLLSVLKEHTFARSSNAQILGLRGMVNMGNTCFMSSILQALVHNPFLRTVFLSDCEWSPSKTTVLHSPRAGETSSDPPLRADFLRLFTEMYSGATAPHAPYYLLHTVWKHSAYLSGYQQQDAHEFLIFILNQLHAQMQTNTLDEPIIKAEANSKPESNSKGPEPAAVANGAAPSNPTMVLKTSAQTDTKSESIISRVFRGTLRSDVTCCGCAAVSTAYDPFFDLPLDLAGRTVQMQPATTTLQSDSEKTTQPLDPPTGDDAASGATAISPAGAGAAATAPSTPRTPREPGSATTINDCLHSFTCTEELDSDGQWVCGACKSNKRTKRLSVAKLPVILVLQVKRFAKTVVPSAKGNGQQVISHKLEQHIKFPSAGLDLRPYTSAEIFSRKQDREAKTGSGTPSSPGDKPRAERVAAMLQPAYTLFSVVVHFGTLEQGTRGHSRHSASSARSTTLASLAASLTQPLTSS
jgi:ubiquitin C-terminal hydrolase